MACIDELHLGDEGTLLLFEMLECEDGTATIVDLTSAVSINIRFKKTDNNILDVTGSVYTGGTNGNGTDGIVQYITQAGDIDVLGKWKAQVTIVFPTGTFNSSIDKSIKVIDNL